MILLLGAAAILSAGPRDTTSVMSKVVTPTINRAPVTGIRSSVIADSIVVEKGKHTLTLFSAGTAVRTYRVALGTQPTGDKVKKGDNRTPEGTFFIDFKNPNSKYHKALHISYPDALHTARANALGRVAGRRHHDSRFAAAVCQHRGRTRAVRLDGRLHRGDGQGDRGDLGGDPDGRADPHQAVSPRDPSVRASILLWSTASGRDSRDLHRRATLIGVALLLSAVIPGISARLHYRWLRIAASVVLVAIPLVMSVLGFLEGRLKAS